MKQVLTLLLSILLSFSIFANENVIEKDGVFYDAQTNKPYSGAFADKYVYERDYMESYSKSKIEEEAIFHYRFNIKDGVRHGVQTLYYSFGRLNTKTDKYYIEPNSYKHTEASFEDGKITLMKDYKKDGTLNIIAKFNGKQAVAHDAQTGKLISEFGYTYGSHVIPPMYKHKLGHFKLVGKALGFHGKRIMYSKRKTHTEHYVNNVKHGKYKTIYNENGQLFLEGTKYKGKDDGEFKAYCKNGKLKTHKTLLMGEEVQVFVDNDFDWCDK